MEYFIRIPLSTLKWFENGELVKNPDFSNNMEVFRVGINENYNDIQRIQDEMTTLAPLDSLSGEATARKDADAIINKRIDELIAGLPTKLSEFENDTGFTTKTYVDSIQTAIQGQLTTLSNNVSDRLVPANIIAGSRVSVSVSGNNVTIGVDISDIENSINTINTNLAKKLEPESILAGSNISVTRKDGKVTIATTGGGGSGAASGISIADAGNYFSTGTVEGALQELGMQLGGISSAVAKQSGVIE
jgi:hypothetical protein